MTNVAIILAAGSGSRFDPGTPKQFLKLAGKPVIQYPLEAFDACPGIDEIIVVVGEEHVGRVAELSRSLPCRTPVRVVPGGRERYDSTRAGMEAAGEGDCNLIIHDAVRPFVTRRIIQACIDCLEDHAAVDVVVDAVDTIVEADGDFIASIPDRRRLRRGQTPQAFRKSVLERAYAAFMADPLRAATDDCGIVRRYLPEVPIKLVRGEEANFKITHPHDICLAESLIKHGAVEGVESPSRTTGSALEDKVVVVFGASSGIGEDVHRLCKRAGARVSGFSRRLTNTDVTRLGDVEAALRRVREEHGPIDFVVNTAGFLSRKPLMTMTEAEILASHQVNYLGVVHVARASFEYLRETRGMLLNFTSSTHARGRSHFSVYSSAKAAVVNFTQAIAEEWTPHGIRVNAISPERTRTPMRAENFGEEPPETLLTSREVAEFTLSAMGTDLSGQVYSVRKLGTRR